MIKSILFIIAFLIFLFGLIYFPKTSKKINILNSMVVCYITELCIGAALSGIYTIFKIPVTLFTIGMSYFILGLFIWGLIIFRKKYQKLSFSWVDLYFFIIITVFFSLLFLKLFTPNISLIYRNSDPGEHYRMAINVMNTHKVGRMYFAPLYNALFMELLQPFLTPITLYKAFILADTFSNYINILMFFILLSTTFRTNLLKLLSPLICILYFLGWPFFSYIVGGFVYFGIGVTLFAYVIYLLILTANCNGSTELKGLFILTLLGIYNVAICYMLFAPVLVLAIILNLWYIKKEKGIILSRKSLIVSLSTIGSLAIIIFLICFIGFFKGNIDQIFSALQTDGGIHRELYEDMIFMLPAVIYMIWYHIKQKELNTISITTLSISGLTAIVFIFLLLGKISGYYYYKLYYLIWFFYLLVCAEAIEHFFEKGKIFLWAYGFPILIASIITLTGIDDWLYTKRLLDENYTSIFSLYDVTKKYLKEDTDDISDKSAFISVCLYINENLTPNNIEIPFITSAEKYYFSPWYSAFTGYETIFVNSGKLPSIINGLKNDQFQYVLLHESSHCYRENNDFFNDYTSIYNDGYYGIYKLN